MARVEIIEHTPALAPDFCRLNLEWLEQLFEVEPVDREILGDPDTHIISAGGQVLYARVGGGIVGTCALKHDGDGVYELTKMCVTAVAQGTGAGRRLLQASIGRFRELAGRQLYLYTNSSLAPAIHLYETEGFEHHPVPQPCPYVRSDVYMILRPQSQD